MFGQYFYNNHIRKSVALFGTLDWTNGVADIWSRTAITATTW